MSTSVTSSALELRKKLTAALGAAIGLDSATSSQTSMRRPGKSSLAETADETPSTQSVTAPLANTPPEHVRWLSRASFGYNRSEGAVLLGMAGATPAAKWQTWVDQQLNPSALADTACTARISAGGFSTLGKTLPQLWAGHVQNDPPYFTRMLPIYETECATVIRALYSTRQVYERAVGFWHDHFSVFGHEYDIAPIFVHYDRDVIRANALGNFRVMLEQTAKSTAMQFFLDNYASRGSEFNENYARELIELHTLGAPNYFGPVDPFTLPCLQTDVHCDGSMPAGYVDNDVYEAAAALTGWTIKNGHWSYPNDNDGTFVYRPDWHDRRNKIFLGHYIPPNTQPAMQDARIVFDRLVSHPGTARYVSTKLCRRFVGDNPSNGLIDAVTLEFQNHIASADQIARMLRVILLSDDFKQGWGGGMRRPFETTMSAFRALEADVAPQPDNTSEWTVWEEFTSRLSQTGHRPFTWAPPDGFPDRQRAWASTGSLAMTLKLLAKLPEIRATRVDTSPFVAPILSQTLAEIPAANRTAGAIIGYWAQRIYGYQPQPAVSVATAMLQQNAAAGDVIDVTKNEWKAGDLSKHYTQERLRTAVGLLLMAPDFFRR